MNPIYEPEIEAAAAEAWQVYQDQLVRNIVAYAAEHTEEFQRRLKGAGLVAEDIRSVAALADVPVLSKDDLPELQEASPPFGGLLACDVKTLKRVFLSPGPILDPEGEGPDFWGWAPALWAAGFRQGETVYNTFSYHLTPAGAMMEEGLRAIGCTVVPGGVGNTDAQVDLLARSGSTGYCGTPDFIWTLLDRAREKSIDVCLERGFVSGGPLSASLREDLLREFGVSVREGYGTADVGAIAFECEASRGWHITPGRVVEVLEPTGEVVVSIQNEVYPLVRFGTGDRSALDTTPCACGRTTPRLLGFQGRVGEGVKVRGMFVHPRSIARALASALGEVPRYEAIVRRVDRRDAMVIRVEAPVEVEVEVEALAQSFRDELKLRVDVELVPPGTLSGDAAPIRDERSW